MLEKMAAAICCYDGCRHSDTCGAHGYEVKARAVLEAMMEPTEAMLNAGVNGVRDFDRHYDNPRDSTTFVWQAMIQAIKEEADD